MCTRCCIWHFFPCWLLQILEMGTFWPLCLCYRGASGTLQCWPKLCHSSSINLTFNLICHWHCCFLKRSLLQGVFLSCAFTVDCAVSLTSVFLLTFMTELSLDLTLSYCYCSFSVSLGYFPYQGLQNSLKQLLILFYSSFSSWLLVCMLCLFLLILKYILPIQLFLFL